MKNVSRKWTALLLALCLTLTTACSSGGFLQNLTGGKSGSEGKTVTMENGSTVFVPGPDDIAEDESTGLRYLKRIILVYPVGDPDEALQKKLSEEAGGKVVGVQSGTVPIVEIRTSAEDYSELRTIADRLAALPEVIFADPETVYEMESETVNTITQDLTPWSADGNEIEDKGKEFSPYGNDWWAEAIRAYSAWDALPVIADPIPVGLLDTGIDADNPEFRDRLLLVKENTIDLDIHKEPSNHGTMTTGITAASGENNIGVRGIADRSKIYFADIWNTYSEKENKATDAAYTLLYTETAAGVCNYYSYMQSQGVRVINHSFGNNQVLTVNEFSNIETRTVEKDWEEILEQMKQVVRNSSSYEDYYTRIEYAAENSAVFLLRYMMIEYAKGNEDFIYVQSAGNGSRFDGTPVSSDLNQYFCSITKPLFDSTLMILKNSYAGDPEISERLSELTWDDIRDRIIIAGGSAAEKVSATEYATYEHSNGGENVDICAPATDIYGLDLLENGNLRLKESAGTSCAAPMVTGSATLLWSAFPDFPASEIKKILTECTDCKVTDPLGAEHPVLNIGLAVEYSLYYTFLRDQMIPRYGIMKGAQDGEQKTRTDQWLNPEGIVTAWIGELDGLRGSEMAVFRFEADRDADYYERPYRLMIDLFTIYDGVVQIQDTFSTGFALRRDYIYDLDLTVSTCSNNEHSDFVLTYSRSGGDLSADDDASWIISCSPDGKLSRQDSDAASYQNEKRVFNLTNLRSGTASGTDQYQFRATDSARMTWYLDFVFTDKSYTPEGYVKEYDVSHTGVSDGLWVNPPKVGDEPRLIRTEDYEGESLKSYHQFAYNENGGLLYDGYFHRDGELSSIIKYDYDDAGFVIRESEVLSNGKEDYVLCYVNDDSGRHIRKDRFPEGGGLVTDWDEYEYDEAGNQTVWRGYRDNKYSFCWYYTYDAAGNHTGTERYDKDGYRTMGSKYEYDTAGHLLSTYAVNDEGNYEAEATYEWSDNYHTRRSPWYYSSNGKLAGYDTYTYDDYGNVLTFRTESVDGSDPVKTRIYYYD